jgi:hypothetical protein
MIWDVPSRLFRLRIRAAKEQAVSAENGILGAPYRPVRLDSIDPPTSHLGYTIYAVSKVNGLRYSPALELAMFHTEDAPNGKHEYVVQSVQRGEPDLRMFDVGIEPAFRFE